MSRGTAIKGGKNSEGEDMDGDYQHGQTSRPRIRPGEKGGSKAVAH